MKHLSRHQRHVGMSLVELMIAMTLGLVILAFVTTLFVSNNKARQELEKTGRQIENGRYAIQLLTDDIRLAGYLGSYIPSSSAPALGAVPDPCAASSLTVSAINGSRTLHVQGYNNGVGAPTCLTDLKPSTDILVVRRASTCATTDANCDPFTSGLPYLQASGCSADPQSYVIDNTAGSFTLRKVNCVTAAEVRRFLTRIYFIANNNVGSDGVPTLKRAELGVDASNNLAWNIVPLVEGIENLQLEYGLDTKTSSPCSGTTPAYTPPCDDGSPDTFTMPVSVQDWWNVVAIKVSLLARNTEATKGYTDTKTYTLGDQSIPAQNDAYKRHAYTASVRLANVAGRRE